MRRTHSRGPAARALPGASAIARRDGERMAPGRNHGRAQNARTSTVSPARMTVSASVAPTEPTNSDPLRGGARSWPTVSGGCSQRSVEIRSAWEESVAVRSSLSQLNGRPSIARFTVLNRTTENSCR